MMYVSQIIMLYTLKLYTAVCQVYLNKTGRKKSQKEKSSGIRLGVKKMGKFWLLWIK